jgi:hypothetical protein
VKHRIDILTAMEGAGAVPVACASKLLVFKVLGAVMLRDVFAESVAGRKCNNLHRVFRRLFGYFSGALLAQLGLISDNESIGLSGFLWCLLAHERLGLSQTGCRATW